MILDNFLMFDVAALVNPNGTTQASTNIIDLHNNVAGVGGIPVLANLQGARDIGIGDDPAMKILVIVTTVYSGGTSLSVALQGAPDNGSGAPGSFATWYVTPVYTTAQLVAGARLMDMDMPRPPAAVGIPRFLRLLYTSVGAVSGNITAGLVLDRDDQVYSSTNNAIMGGYPAGINVAN
jgi:hypothetical protein